MREFMYMRIVVVFENLFTIFTVYYIIFDVFWLCFIC